MRWLCIILAALYVSYGAIGAKAQTNIRGEPEGVFVGGSAGVSLAHRFPVNLSRSGTAQYLSEKIVGQFELFGSYGLVRHYQWDLLLDYRFQFLWGGLENSHGTIPAATFILNLYTRWWLTPNLNVQLGILHESSHQVDPPKFGSLSEYLDFSKVVIDVPDLDLPQLHIQVVTPDNSLAIGLQPWHLNYFLLSGTSRMFRSDSYQPYPHLLLASTTRTLWRSEDYRVIFAWDCQSGGGTVYAAKVGFSFKPSNTNLELDHIQLALIYEGGMDKNYVGITPYTGLTRNWCHLDGKFLF